MTEIRYIFESEPRSRRVSRRRRTCCECGGAIARGDTYERIARDHGERTATCCACDAWRDAFVTAQARRDAADVFVPSVGALWSAIADWTFDALGYRPEGDAAVTAEAA